MQSTGITFTGGFSLTPSGGAPVIITSSYIALGTNHSAGNGGPIHAYRWSSSGFGTKFSAPGTLPGGISRGVAFNPTNSALFVTTTVTPFIHAYAWSDAGFGTKYSNPTSLPPAASGSGPRALAVNAAGTAVAVCHRTTSDAWGAISIYAWNNSTGFGTKYSDPSPTFISGVQNHYGVAFSPNDSAIAMAVGNSPWVIAYSWNNSTGFGSRFSNPSSLPGSSGTSVSFSPSGDAVAVVAAGSTPYTAVYRWSESGFGTKYADPSPALGTNPSEALFNKAGNAIFFAGSTTLLGGGVTAYAWDSTSGFGTKYTNAATAMGATVGAVAVANDDSAVATALSSSSRIGAYAWNNTTGFGSKFSDPATLPGVSGGSTSIAFSN